MQQLSGWFSAFLATVWLLGGRASEAEGLAREALAVTEAVRFPYGVGIAQRALGRVAAAAGDGVGAERWLRASLASFTAIGAPFEAARTRLDLGLACGAGSSEAALQLGEARRTFTELRLPLYVERVEAQARELAPPPAPARSNEPNVR
jgi:hypothetical protein